MVLSTAYLPPIEYFAQLAKYSVVYLEAFENYSKQSYRNRCRILSANGPLDLSFPIRHDGASLITDIRVDYSTPWLERTRYAIDSAYYNSPYFEYYRDTLFEVMDRRPGTLWELNLSLIRYLCSKIGLNVEIRPTEAFTGEALDIHPKHVSDFRGREYWQVFRDRFGFVGNLSVLDLLCNEGPGSFCYL